MSDETKTKLEGDDAITLAMVNVWRSTMGRAPYTSSEWAKWPEERSPAMVALSWVRANLVAPAVAEAISKTKRDQDKHHDNIVEVAGRMVAAERERNSLRVEVRRLSNGWDTDVRVLRAKVAELEAQVKAARCGGAMEALLRVQEKVEDMGRKGECPLGWKTTILDVAAHIGVQMEAKYAPAAQ